MSRANQSEPKVGIFWLFCNRIIADCTAVSIAERYGDCLTHATSHIDFWSQLQQSRLVPVEVDYEEAPRGRVVYDTVQGRFVIFADRCILGNKAVVREIIKEMNLPNAVETNEDSHYRCCVCLSRES